MRNTFRLMMGLLALALAVSWAQGPRGPQPVSRAGQGQPLLDMTKQVAVEGAVSAVHIAFGAQYPSIEVNKTTIKIAPVWFLLENDFELKEGDLVRVTAAPSTVPADPYLHAIQIVNTMTGAQIMLRNEAGVPLWVARKGLPFGSQLGAQGQRGHGSGYSGCLDPASTTTISGEVERVTMGAGIQQPTLVIKQGDGTLVSVKIGPERILLENEFELNPGEPVAAKVAVATCKDELVALELTNADGVTVVLRDDLGRPAWD